MSNRVYEIVTEKIIAALESGTPPWRKPWQSGVPRNAITNRPYSGINALLLAMTPYADPRWLTFNQCSQKGGRVRKGEKSALVVFWKLQSVNRTGQDGDDIEAQLPFIRYYKLFNVEQCEGLGLTALEPRTVDSITEAEAVIANMPNPPGIAFDGGDQAYYLPHRDSIHLPTRESFDNAGEFYSTLFHELAHSTGHQSRLNRATLAEVAPFGSETYSREELVAEFGAAFLCAHAGIDAVMDNSAAYIFGWSKKLRSDPRLVIIAASQGQRAADSILNHGAGF